MDIYWMIAIVIVGLLAFIGGWLSNKKIGQAKVANAEKMAEKIIKDAENTANTLKKEKLLEVKDEWFPNRWFVLVNIDNGCPSKPAIFGYHTANKYRICGIYCSPIL